MSKPCLVRKRTKFRKQHKGRIHGVAKSSGALVNFGSYGLKALGPGRVTARQIEAARRRYDPPYAPQREGLDPDFPRCAGVSTKPAEVRMGKGKGAPEYWVARVKPGRVMFEVDGVPLEVAERAMELAAAKLPLPTKFVKRLGV